MVKRKTSAGGSRRGGKVDRNRGRSESESSEEDEFWEVEKILDKKMKKSVPHYYVKWRGFSDDDCTWEPLENLENAKALVAAFEKDQENAAKDSEKAEKASSPGLSKSSKKIAKVDRASIKKSLGGRGKRKDTEEESASVKSEDKTKAKKEKRRKKKKDNEIEEETDSQILQNSGTFSIDHPIKIIDHAVLDDSGNKLSDPTANTSLSQVYFEIEWKKRDDGIQPGPTYYTYDVLKKNYPSIILDYIENMVHFD